MLCYRHPKVETNVSCGKCDRPICPRCMVAGPAGMRCPDCASLRKTSLYQIPPQRIALAVAAGLVTGLIGAFLMTVLGFFVIFVGPIYGGIVAQAVLWASGRKRGPILEVIGIGSILLGAAAALLGPLLGAVQAGGSVPLGINLVGYAWPLLGFGLAISTCYARLKYL